MVSRYIRDAARRINGELSDRCCVIVSMDDAVQPIIHVTDAFLTHTGYSRDEVIGKNCRMLQGPETSPAARAFLRRAIEKSQAATVDILNYRANGEPFWFRLNITPMRSADGVTTHFLGVQVPLDKRPETPLMQHNTSRDHGSIL